MAPSMRTGGVVRSRVTSLLYKRWGLVTALSLASAVFLGMQALMMSRGGVVGRKTSARMSSGIKNDLQAAGDGCFEHDGASYSGKASTTRSGKRCLRWDSLEKHQDSDVMKYADLWGAALDSNFCRNPTGKDGGPWCFTEQDGGGVDQTLWELCNVPMCQGNTELPIEIHDASPTGTPGGPFECPRSYTISPETYRAMRKYDLLTKEATYDPRSSPLHYFSLYGATSLWQWDELVKAHVARLGYRAGERVFEAGSAAGAFVDSLQRQFGVQVSGIDVSQAAVKIARSRVNGTFCAANAESLAFVPEASFDHSLSFAVLMYVRDVPSACKVASELVRIVKPGGTVFLGQINDPDMRRFSSKSPEGSWGVDALFWYRFAQAGGHAVEIAKGEDVYSKRVVPGLDHYDLHAPLRYNVYMRASAGREKASRGICETFRSGRRLGSTRPRKRLTDEGAECILPFTVCLGACADPQSASFGQGVLVDDCTSLGSKTGREWCSVAPLYSLSGDPRSNTSWGYCKPLRGEHPQEVEPIFGG